MVNNSANRNSIRIENKTRNKQQETTIPVGLFFFSFQEC